MRTARIVAPPLSSRVMTAGATGDGGPSSTATLPGTDVELAGGMAGCGRGP